jgi:serine/threonine protein kinase
MKENALTQREMGPGSPQDVRLAARLVVEQVIPEGTMRAVLAKQKELLERQHPLLVSEICLRKGWVTATEIRWLQAPDEPPADLIPGLSLGRLLGQGGMSRVYVARLRNGATNAVKILHPRLRRDPTAVADFLREGELLISLEHENVVRGHALAEHDGLVYLTMEYIDGQSVLEHLDRSGPFAEDAALYIILQTARALTHLHERGIVHRDVKPGNILIDAENTVKLCDLGLAVKSGADGDAEVTAGTIDYIAPEQAEGRGGLDVRSDIYALGVTLFQLLVGKLPFEGGTNEEALARRLLDELRSPELKGRNISPHAHYFIQKMMALDREIRYQSPHELIQDIEEQIRGKKTLHAQPGRKSSGTLELEKPFQPTRQVKPVPVMRRRPSR